MVRRPLRDYLQRRYPDTQMWCDEQRADLEDAFEHGFWNTTATIEDIVLCWRWWVFKLISCEPARWRADANCGKSLKFGDAFGALSALQASMSNNVRLVH